MPRDFQGTLFWLGEPLLFKLAAWLTFGHVADGFTVTMHPVAFAAWFGMLATALNLFPIGQLDGGHISYAVLGRKSTLVTLVMVACLIGLAFWSRVVGGLGRPDGPDADRLRAPSPPHARRRRAARLHP